MGSHSNAPPPASPEVRATLDSIRRLVQALRRSGQDARLAVGLSSAQLFVLQQLDRSTPLSIRELAEATLTHQSSVSVVAQRLVDAGYAQKGKAVADGRRAALTLTARGQQLLRRAPDPVQHDLIRALSRLTPARRRGLSLGLRALVRELGLATGAAEMFFEGPQHV